MPELDHELSPVMHGIFNDERRSDVVVPRPDGASTVMVIAYEGDAGAAYFSDADGPWITRNPTPLACPPLVPVDGHVPYYFPPYSVLPLRIVQAGVAAYLRTGERPRCVEWIRINWHTVAG